MAEITNRNWNSFLAKAGVLVKTPAFFVASAGGAWDTFQGVPGHDRQRPRRETR